LGSIFWNLYVSWRGIAALPPPPMGSGSFPRPLLPLSFPSGLKFMHVCKGISLFSSSSPPPLFPVGLKRSLYLILFSLFCLSLKFPSYTRGSGCLASNALLPFGLLPDRLDPNEPNRGAPLFLESPGLAAAFVQSHKDPTSQDPFSIS